MRTKREGKQNGIPPRGRSSDRTENTVGRIPGEAERRKGEGWPGCAPADPASAKLILETEHHNDLRLSNRFCTRNAMINI
jgi:hypothetical protein